MSHRIDFQHHALPPAYVAAIGAERIGQMIVSGRSPDWSPAASVAAMDRNGIRLALLSISAPGLEGLAPAAAAEMARICNDAMAEARARHPGRFGFFLCLPLPETEAALAELARGLDELGADGVCLMTRYGAAYQGDPAFDPLMAELDRRGTLVHIHPTAEPGPAKLPHLPAATLEFPFETTRAAANLVLSGTLSRFARIRFILSHAGGTVPMLAERISRLERRPDIAAKVPEGVLPLMRRFWFDTALSASPRTFAALRNLVGADRILFASDYPFAPEDTMTATVRGLSTLGLAEEDLRAIESGNALTLLPHLAALA